MLISIALTLLIMAAMVQVFDLMGNGLREGRASIAMAGQLRSVAHRLQQDLDGITAPTLPWIDPDAGMGYLEVIEGLGSDSDSDADQLVDYDPGDTDVFGQPNDTSLGDVDDVLMFTTRSRGEPFVGRILGSLSPRRPDGRIPVVPTGVAQVIESQVAEVIWWVRYSDTNGNGIRDLNEPFALYRRLLLVRPDLDVSRFSSVENTFFNGNDISARLHLDANGMVTNSLSDLTKRENRYAHRRLLAQNPGGSFPYPLDRTLLAPKSGLFRGEDVILADVLAFDVRVYDPQAPLDFDGAQALIPGDPGYNWSRASSTARAASTVAARGAFVDLNYARDRSTPLVGSLFSGPSHLKSRLIALADGTPASVYDTWPSHYERDGIDQDGDGGPDEGTNGLDDDNINGVDDVLERETAAPYGVPLRGIQVAIRMMDFGTRQVRQVSVVGDFVPE